MKDKMAKVKETKLNIGDLNSHFKPRVKWEGVRKYDEDMPKRAYESMASGFSRSATAGSLGIAHATLLEWCKIYPEFNDAVTAGVAAGQKLWEELAQTPQHDQYCSKAYAFNMANIYKVVTPQPTVIVPVEGGADKAKEIMRDLANDGAI